ncbi:hypothetical protein EBU24_01120, partial [bacterium]|nr:hypothetical protein [bacterium]
QNKFNEKNFSEEAKKILINSIGDDKFYDIDPEVEMDMLPAIFKIKEMANGALDGLRRDVARKEGVEGKNGQYYERRVKNELGDNTLTQPITIESWRKSARSVASYNPEVTTSYVDSRLRPTETDKLLYQATRRNYHALGGPISRQRFMEGDEVTHRKAFLDNSFNPGMKLKSALQDTPRIIFKRQPKEYEKFPNMDHTSPHFEQFSEMFVGSRKASQFKRAVEYQRLYQEALKNNDVESANKYDKLNKLPANMRLLAAAKALPSAQEKARTNSFEDGNFDYEKNLLVNYSGKKTTTRHELGAHAAAYGASKEGSPLANSLFGSIGRRMGAYGKGSGETTLISEMQAHTIQSAKQKDKIKSLKEFISSEKMAKLYKSEAHETLADSMQKGSEIPIAGVLGGRHKGIEIDVLKRMMQDAYGDNPEVLSEKMSLLNPSDSSNKVNFGALFADSKQSKRYAVGGSIYRQRFADGDKAAAKSQGLEEFYKGLNSKELAQFEEKIRSAKQIIINARTSGSMKLKSVGFNFLGKKFNLADKLKTKTKNEKPIYDLKGVKSLDELLSKIPPNYSEELRAKIGRAQDKFLGTKNIKDLKFAYDFGDKRGPLNIQLEKDVIKFGTIATFPWKPKTRKEKRTEELRIATERNARKKAQNIDKARQKSETASELNALISSIDEENQQSKFYGIARDTKVFEGSDQYKELQKKLALDRQQRERKVLPTSKEGMEDAIRQLNESQFAQPQKLIGINENYKAIQPISGTSPQAQRLRMQMEEREFQGPIIGIAKDQKTKKGPRVKKTEGEKYNIARKQSAPAQEKTLFDEMELAKIGTYQTQEERMQEDADKIKRFRDAAAESRIQGRFRLNERKSNRVRARAIANENLADNLMSLRSKGSGKPIVSQAQAPIAAQATNSNSAVESVILKALAGKQSEFWKTLREKVGDNDSINKALASLKDQGKIVGDPNKIGFYLLAEKNKAAKTRKTKPVVSEPITTTSTRAPSPQIPEDYYNPYGKPKKPRAKKNTASSAQQSNFYNAQESEYQKLLDSINAQSRSKKRRGFASGGLVPGTGNSDTVPMDLPEGSFVIRKSSVNKIGADNLAKASRFASGGTVPALVMPGEYIYSPEEARKIGSSKLHAMNQFAKFAKGGSVKLARGGTPLSEDNTFDPADPRKMARLAKQLVDQQMQNNPDLTRGQARTQARASYNDIKTKGQTLVDTSAEANRLKQQLERSTKSLEDQQTVTENLSKGIKGLEAAQKKQEAYLRANPGDARAQKKLDSVNNQLADKRRELVSEKSRLVPLRQTVAADQAQYKTAEDLQSKAKVELDQYKVNKSGEVTLNNKVVGEQPANGPGSISDIVKQKTAQFEATFNRKATKEDKKNLKMEALGEYRAGVEKQVRADAQKRGKPVSELQVQSVVDNYVNQASKGQRKLITNAQGEVTGDTGLGRKLVGGGYKETGDLTTGGIIKDKASRLFFGSKRSDFEAGAEGDRQFKEDKASTIANRATSFAVGASLLSSGIKAGAPEVSSLAKANEQGVVVEDKAQQEAYRSTLQFAGAIEKAGTYAATTATALAPLGPVGAALGAGIGGLVGLIKGYADGAKEAEAQIREVKLGAALTGLQGTFEKLNSGLKTFDDSIAESIAANQKIITEANAGKAFAEAGGEKDAFDRLISGITGGGFQGFDVKKFNELNSKNQKEVGAAQIVPLTNILNKQAEQLGANAVKQAGGNAGELDYKNFATSLETKLTDSGFNNQQIQKIANARNVSFDDVKKEIVKVMKDSFKAAQLEKTQKEAVTANQRSINSMALLSEAVVAAANSVESFSNKLSTNESFFSGGIGSTKVTGISNQFDQKSTPDFNSFNSAVSKLSDSLGTYGNEFKAQGNAINAASQALPSLLAGAVEDPVGGQDIAIQIASGLREALGAQGIKGAGAEKVVSSVAGNISGQEYTKLLAEAGGDVSKVAEKLLGNIKDPFLNAAKDISQKLENASNQYISGLENLAQRQKQIGESFKNLEGAKLQRDKFTAETVATNIGLPSQAGNLISVDRQMQGFRTNQERLTGTKGAEAQDSRVIGDNLKRVQEKIRELEPKVQNASGAEGGGAAFRGAASELVKLKSEASNLQESLKNLADQSNNLAILEAKLGQVRQERDAETQRGRAFLTADPKERQKILQDRLQGQGLLRQAQAQGGNVSNFSSKQNKVLFDFLDSFGPIGKDIADNIVRNTTGLGKKKPEEDALVGKLSRVYDEQVKANQELIGNQRSLQSDYFSQLTKQNTTFYSNLDKFIAGMEKSQVQDEKNREVAKSAKIKDVQEKSGFLRDAGVTDENLKDVNANKGKISELIRAKEARKNEAEKFSNTESLLNQESFKKGFQNIDSGERGSKAALAIGSQSGTIDELLSKLNFSGKENELVRQKASTSVSNNSNISISTAILDAIKSVSTQGLSKSQERVTTAEKGAGELGVKIANKAQEQGINAEKFESSLTAVSELNQGIGVKLTAAAETATTNINRLSASISGLGAQQQGIAPVNVNANPAQAIGFAVGGPAFAPRGTDTVPAMLTPGEFVVNRNAAQQNLPLLKSINSGKTSYLAEGGEVGALDKRIKASEEVMNIWNQVGPTKEEKIAAIKNNISSKFNSLKNSTLANVPSATQDPEKRKTASSAILSEVISSLSTGQLSQNPNVKKTIEDNGGFESLQDFANIFSGFKQKGETENTSSNKKQELIKEHEALVKKMKDDKVLDIQNLINIKNDDIRSVSVPIVSKFGSDTVKKHFPKLRPDDPNEIIKKNRGYVGYGVELAGNLMGIDSPAHAIWSLDIEKRTSGDGYNFAEKVATEKIDKLLSLKNLNFDEESTSLLVNNLESNLKSVFSEGNKSDTPDRMGINMLRSSYFYNGSDKTKAVPFVSYGSPPNWPGLFAYENPDKTLIDPIIKESNKKIPTKYQSVINYLKKNNNNIAKYTIPENLDNYEDLQINNKYMESLGIEKIENADTEINKRIPEYIAQIEALKAQKKDIVSEKKQEDIVANIANEEGTTPIDTKIRMAENEVLAARGNKQLESQKKSELEVLKLRRASYNQIGLTSNEKLKNAYSENRPEINQNYIASKAYLTQIKEGTGEKFVATDMAKEDELFLKRQGDAARLAQIGLRREVQASAIIGKMVRLKGIFAKNQGEDLNKKDFIEIGKDPNQLIPLGLNEYASLYNGQKGSLTKEDFDNPKLILPFQKEIVSSFFKQQASSKSLAISGKGLLDFIDQYSNIKDTKGFIDAKVKQSGPDAIPLVVRAIEEGKINALNVLNAAAANVGGISRKSLEGAIGRNANFNLLDKLSEKQEGKAQKIVRAFSGIDFIEGEDGAYATIKAASGKGQVSMSAKNTALRIAAPYLSGAIYNNLGLPLGYSREQLKQLAGDMPTLGSPSGSLTFAADTPNLFTTEDFLNVISSSQGYATISSKAVVVEEDIDGKKQRKIDYKRNLDIANIENSRTREAMKSILNANKINENAPEQNNNVVKGQPNEFQAAIIKEREDQAALANILPRATREQQLYEGQYGELSVESRLNRGEISREEAVALIERQKQARKMSSGGVVNYLSSGGVPSHRPNPDPSFFKPKGTDTVPAMLTPGEFVINAAATAKHGDLLSAINSGKDVGYSSNGGTIYLEDGGEARKKAFYEKMNRQKKYEEEGKNLVSDKDKYSYMQNRKDMLENTRNKATQKFSKEENEFLSSEEKANEKALHTFGMMGAGFNIGRAFVTQGIKAISGHGIGHAAKHFGKEAATEIGSELLMSSAEKSLNNYSTLFKYAGGLISYLALGGYSQRRANLANYSGSEEDTQLTVDEEGYIDNIGKYTTSQITNRIAAKNQAENNAFQMFSNTRFNDGTGSLFDNTQAGFSIGSGGVSAQQALSFQDPTRPGGEGITQAAMGMLGDVQSRMRGGNNPFGNISATGAEVNALKQAKANEPEIQRQSDELKKQIKEYIKQQQEENPDDESVYASLGGLIYAQSGFDPEQYLNDISGGLYQNAQQTIYNNLNKPRTNIKNYRRPLANELIRNIEAEGFAARVAASRNKSRQQLQPQLEQWQINWQQQQANRYRNPYAALQSRSMFPQQRQQLSENFQNQRAYQANQEMYGGPSAQPAFQPSNYAESFFNQVPKQQIVQDPKRKQLSLFGINLGSYSSGGNVDTIPAMLTPGEFVVNKEASSKNSSLLHAINNGQEVAGFAKGGSVGNIRGRKIDPVESGISSLAGKLSGVGNKFIESGDSFKSGANANREGAQNILASSSKFNAGVGNFADSANKISKRKGYNSGGLVNYFADGGFTPRGTDTVPAMLTPGEFVVNRESTSKNLNLLKAINGNTSYMSNGGVMYARRGAYVENSQQDSTKGIDMTSVTQLADAITKLGTTFLKPFGEQIDTFKTYAEALQTQVNKIPSIINIEVMGNLNASLNIDFNPEGVYTAVTQATQELQGWIVTEINRQLRNEMNT